MSPITISQFGPSILALRLELRARRRTRSPLCRSRRTTWLPIKPVAPVTNVRSPFIGLLEPGRSIPAPPLLKFLVSVPAGSHGCRVEVSWEAVPHPSGSVYSPPCTLLPYGGQPLGTVCRNHFSYRTRSTFCFHFGIPDGIPGSNL